MLLYNDNVLLFLYEKLFPQSQLLSTDDLHFNRAMKKINLRTDTSSRMSMLKQNEMYSDQQSMARLGANPRSESQTTLPGSRLNLTKSQTKDMEKMFPQASNFVRKSYGGNTQLRYQTTDQDQSKEKIANKNLKNLINRKS
jgi:hypothetical protein